MGAPVPDFVGSREQLDHIFANIFQGQKREDRFK